MVPSRHSSIDIAGRVLELAPAMAAAAGLVSLAAAFSVPARSQEFNSEEHTIRAEVVAKGLEHPWAVAFLPDGRILITERPGRIRIVRDGSLDPEPVSNVPAVYARNQGGLLDLVPHPEFASNGWIYLSYAVPDRGGARTALARGRIEGHALVDLEVLFEADNPASGGRHFGSRIVFGPEGMLYLTVGDRGESDEAQDLSNHNGTVVRLMDDGSVPADNPFFARPPALPEVYTFGHRNPQGIAVRPETGQIWLSEHGPRGGDEVNLLRAGANYGWPTITYGRAYSGFRIGEGTAKAGLEQPVLHWTPSIAPSGSAFYDGDLFPNWKGNLFVGALKFRYLSRLELVGDAIVHEEQLLRGEFGRIRDVRQGPDGALYLLTDQPNGRLVRLSPPVQLEEPVRN